MWSNPWNVERHHFLCNVVSLLWNMLCHVMISSVKPCPSPQLHTCAKCHDQACTINVCGGTIDCKHHFNYIFKWVHFGISCRIKRIFVLLRGVLAVALLISDSYAQSTQLFQVVHTIRYISERGCHLPRPCLNAIPPEIPASSCLIWGNKNGKYEKGTGVQGTTFTF